MSENISKATPRQYKVSRSDLPQACPNDMVEEGIAHPRVVLKFEDSHAICPYCGTEYLLKD